VRGQKEFGIFMVHGENDPANGPSPMVTIEAKVTGANSLEVAHLDGISGWDSTNPINNGHFFKWRHAASLTDGAALSISKADFKKCVDVNITKWSANPAGAQPQYSFRSSDGQTTLLQKNKPVELCLRCPPN
jgi:uncharacterized protein (DUF779 family)